ncbi:MAG: FMN-binding protein [Deltaproteobacteria bacterium]
MSISESASFSKGAQGGRRGIFARRPLRTLGVAFCALLLAAAPAFPGAFYGRKDGLAEIFPAADTIEKQRFFLTEEQAAEVTKLSGARLEDRLVTLHIGKKAGAVLGYAFFETHIVRTQPETLFIRVSPDGKVERVLMAAFYEPRDYMASERWLAQFPGQELDADLRVRREIHGIGGATLTAHAVTKGVRKTLALHRVLIDGNPDKD